jgi:hypothetical protein
VFAEDGKTPLGGVCLTLTGDSRYSVCDDGDGDADPSPGNIELPDVVAGNYELSVQPPDSYEPTGDVPSSVPIDAGEITSLTLTFRPRAIATPTATATAAVPGVVIVLTTLEDGTTPVDGVCMSLTDADVYQACDDGETDADPTLGIIEIDDVPPGEYRLDVTSPAGFEPVELPATVQVPAGDLVQIDLSFRPAGSPIPTEATPVQPAQGVVVVQSFLEDGVTPVGEVCLVLTGPDTYEVCDDGEDDLDPTTGAIEIDGVLTGDYTLTITPPAGYDPIEAPENVTVPADVAQVILTFRAAGATPEATPAQVGFVIAAVTGEDGATLGGACLTLTGPLTYEVCDDGEGDADPSPGNIELDGVAVGDYDVSAQPPPDHEPVGEAPARVHVDLNAFAELTFVFRPVAAATPTEEPTAEPTAESTVEATPAPALGSLVISKVDAADGTTPLGGACFTISAADGLTADACDDDGDGLTSFKDLAPGDWRIQETRAPEGYEPGPEQTVTVPAGAEATAVVPNAALLPQTGTLAALAVDPEDKPLPGACYAASGPDGAAVDGCDDDGDGRADLGEVPAGDWVVRQTDPPAGYDPGAPEEQSVPVTAGQPGEVRFVNAPTPPEQLRLPPPLPKPTSVVAAGDFQDELGCPQDNDPTCPATALVDNHGIWIGSFPIPPGTYALRLIATSDVERSLGKGGAPDGDALVVTVPAGTASVYVEYDPATGRIVVAARPIRAQLASELGIVELRPIEHGRFQGYLDVPAGALPVQILFNGQVVKDDQIERDQEGRVRVVVDAEGEIASVDPVTPTSLIVARAAADGAPLTGSCFALLDGNNALAGQACDADDGAADGTTTIAFPNGVAEGTYTLRETLAAEGNAPAPDQEVELVAGENEELVST